jgi:DNA topoisomerase 2-associated protein PAT1
MSFFGFNSALPRDDPGSGKAKGIFETQDPFAQVRQARKLQAFQDTQDEPYVLVIHFA